jgi:glucuronate isomerase
LSRSLILHPDRLLPADPIVRDIARSLYGAVADLPVSGASRRIDPETFAADRPFANACDLIVANDPAVHRLLHSQGVDLKQLGAPGEDEPFLAIPRKAWRLFARHAKAFRGTTQGLWLDQVFSEVFGLSVHLEADTADLYYDTIGEALAKPAFRPRALTDRLNIERIAVPTCPTQSLDAYGAMAQAGWSGRLAPTYEPDAVIDVDDERFDGAMSDFALATGEDVYSWRGYLRAHRKRRAQFIALGAKASVHRHPTAATADLAPSHAAALFRTIVSGRATGQEPELFRAQMLTELARMSLDDGLVMTLRTGAFSNHDRALFRDHGRDRGADIPRATDYVTALRPLLNLYGADRRLTLVVRASDEAALSRELAPMAGHYPALKLAPGAAFFDGPDSLRRFREITVETAGFANAAAFSDEASTILSLAPRHDMARRSDCGWLAGLVAQHRLTEDDAREIATDLAYGAARPQRRLDGPAPKLLPQSA